MGCGVRIPAHGCLTPMALAIPPLSAETCGAWVGGRRKSVVGKMCLLSWLVSLLRNRPGRAPEPLAARHLQTAVTVHSADSELLRLPRPDAYLWLSSLASFPRFSFLLF